MPTIEEVTRMLSDMDKDTYGEAVRFICYLVANSQKKSDVLERQMCFIRETAGKISVDEAAIDDLRMRSMI